MLTSEGRVKRLDPEFRGIRREVIGRHERQRPQSPYVAIVQGATIRKVELKRAVSALVARQRPIVVDQQCARESGLHDDAVCGREVQHDQLRTPPTAFDARTSGPLGELPSGHATKDVSLSYLNVRDGGTAHARIEVASDGLGL